MSEKDRKEESRKKKSVLVFLIIIVICLSIPIYAFLFSNGHECTSNPFVWGINKYGLKECTCKNYENNRFAVNKTDFWEIKGNDSLKVFIDFGQNKD